MHSGKVWNELGTILCSVISLHTYCPKLRTYLPKRRAY
jgi:hypothetical protein